MKIENLKFVKKLQPFIKNVSEKNKIYETIKGKKKQAVGTITVIKHIPYKTLDFEQAIEEVLPKKIKIDSVVYNILMFYADEWRIQYHNGDNTTLYITFGKTLFEAVVKMLDYLIEHKLLKEEEKVCSFCLSDDQFALNDDEQICSCDLMDMGPEDFEPEFKEFTGDYEKQFYDISLPNGTIIKECWPNAGFIIDIEGDNKLYGPGECKIKVSKETYYHKPLNNN